MDHEEQHTSGISRRAVTTGMAWSVPVIALAVATPLAAASNTLDISTPDDFADVTVGDPVPLVFVVLVNDVPVTSGVLRLELDDTATVTLDPEGAGYSNDTTSNMTIEDGLAIAPAFVTGAGTATGRVTYVSTIASFEFDVVLAG